MTMTGDFPPRLPPGPPMPLPPRPPSSGMGTAGFICGLLGVIIGLLLSVALGMVLSVLGIIFGAVGRSKSGLTLGIVGLVISGLAWLAVSGAM